MQSKYKPVIVVVAFDRQESLKRILSSLQQSYCPAGTKLIISIDNNGKNQQVAEYANVFEWEFGEKEVIYHKERLGLRQHILKCGDLTYEYGSIIMLEDDLYMSSYFYQYTQEALDYYHGSEKIAGISLYNLPYSESIKLPFSPLKDNSDVYFMQIPSSLGQAWSKDHWTGFRKWYNENPDIKNTSGLPWVVKNRWPESSWKKFFYAYIIEFDKYFVFPILSLSTNFNDLGTNMIAETFFGQVEIQTTNIPRQFIEIDNAINVYDAHSELCPEKMDMLCDTLKGYEYELDLYGKKDTISAEYVLTSKACRNPIKSFKRTMKPQELNIIYNIGGSDFHLVKKENVLSYPNSVADLKNTNAMMRYIPDFSFYFTNLPDTHILIKILKFRLASKIKKLFRK